MGRSTGSLAGQGKKMTGEFYGIAKWSVEFAIGLIGIMALWLGIFKIAEDSGLIGTTARVLSPILRLLFPKVPRDHPANGAIFASMSANFLGLDNAATPLSIKAMQELQTLNKSKDTITNDQIMLLALNTSSVNFIPISIIGYRVASDSQMPNDIILPTIIATGCATVVAVIMAKALAPFSTDPAAAGEEAERITRELIASRRGTGDSTEEAQS
jgi:spore maturation protein A